MKTPCDTPRHYWTGTADLCNCGHFSRKATHAHLDSNRAPRTHHYRMLIRGRGVKSGEPWSSYLPSKYKTIALVTSAARRIAEDYRAQGPNAAHIDAVDVVRFDKWGIELPEGAALAASFDVWTDGTPRPQPSANPVAWTIDLDPTDRHGDLDLQILRAMMQHRAQGVKK